MRTITYTLPTVWASYLANNDDSGITQDDKSACDAFLVGEGLRRADCATMEDDTHFAKWNHAVHVGHPANLAQDVATFTFLVRR